MIRGPALAIATGRFVLRSMDESGVEPLRRWMADARIGEALAQPPRALTAAGAKAYIARFDNRTSFLLGIYERSSERLLGFYALQVDRRHLTATGSLVVGEEEALNQAVAAETARAIADWAFETAGLEKLIAQVAETNTLVANWLGTRMQLEGRLRDEVRTGDGRRLTVLRFGLLRSEWAAVRARSIARQAERGH